VSKKPSRFGANGNRSDRAKPNDHLGHVVYNRLLLGLPSKMRKRLFASLEPVRLPLRTVLCEMGAPIRYAYFINGGLASILSVMADGKSVEVGLTGKEGFVGVPLIVGYKTSPTRVIMQIEGTAFRMDAKDLTSLLRSHAHLDRSLQRYSQEIALQAVQVAACNRLHDVDARLARWLLMSQDRINGNVVPLTQEFLSHMLGTRRASVTVAAAMLQKTGSISYERGRTTIADRKRLEKAACECYGILRKQSRVWEAESQ
jgi:CRP-like cAMP-binding protein